MKKQYSLRGKLILLCLLILLIPTLAISISAYNISKNELNESGAQQLKDNTQKIIDMIALLDKQVDSGYLSQEDAEEQLREQVTSKMDSKGIRQQNPVYTVGKSGYTFAIDEEGTIVLSPQGEGSSMVGSKTEEGMDMGKTFLDKGKKGGFITYTFTDPRTHMPEKMIAYVEKDPNWGWTVGSDATANEFHHGAKLVSKWIIIITAIALVLGGMATYLFAVRFTNPLRVISKELKKAAKGDFSGENITVKTNDETGELAKDFSTMKTNMQSLISMVKHLTVQVASSSEQLTASAEESNQTTKEIAEATQLVAAGAQSNSQSIEESAYSLEEVTIGIQNLAENAMLISTSSKHVIEQADEGKNFVMQTGNQIRLIHQQVKESNNVLKLLETSSKEIGEISNSIIAIADQTNLLSLNAAIEAARAGEHGRGFAVVADEVRKLAEQSQNSSQQISEIVKEINGHMANSTASMNHVSSEVDTGISIIEKTEMKFSDIVQSMTAMANKVSDMAATVEEMSAGTEEVSATFTHMASLTKDASNRLQYVAASTSEQQTAIEEITHSSTELSKLASELQQHVHILKV
ncbi:methyl-accepting chemotaxis protein [Bacillus testis]|uniref:methyl-accepting chemotaxis protein n=1 Tax=Bacillus testis TaxID=1622072 RepID=UPI00067F62B6|nr:methyl-accepting chemotaxis protein [Bacillus testis]